MEVLQSNLRTSVRTNKKRFFFLLVLISNYSFFMLSKYSEYVFNTNLNLAQEQEVKDEDWLLVLDKKKDYIPPLSCQRTCLHRRNIISYTDGPTSGLSDRKVIIRDLSQLAGYLCAHLVMSPPSAYLTSDHNNDIPISNRVSWQDLYNITFMDGSPTIPFVKKKKVDDNLLDEDSRSWSDVLVFDTQSDASKHKDWFHIVSTEGKVQEDFQAVQTFSFQQESAMTQDSDAVGFVWESHAKWYQFDLWTQSLPELPDEIKAGAQDRYDHAMRPYLATYYDIHPKIKEKNKEGCMYTNIDTYPSHVKKIQKRLIKRIKRHSPSNSAHGILHLRRGDVMDECDTNINRMREYFECSFNGTNNLGYNLTLLLTSDEKDMDYTKSIIELADDYNHVSIMDADKMVKTVIREATRNGVLDKHLDNNYFVFEVESILRDWSSDFVKFHFVRRRSSCADCIPLAKILAREDSADKD